MDEIEERQMGEENSVIPCIMRENVEDITL